jgi:hypothetical protein
MGKITIFLALFMFFVEAKENASAVTRLEQNCLSCHTTQQIPNSLIYRRYLMKYSTEDRIAKAMLDYVMHPKKSQSIMPPQFFLKFPMKEAGIRDKDTLRQDIETYIERYDVKKNLILEDNSH